MRRARISTTVDAERLAKCRTMLRVVDSQIIDRALSALITDLEAELELAALTANPYDDDLEVAWVAAPGPDLPYEGRIPASVTRLAARRRRR